MKKVYIKSTKIRTCRLQSRGRSMKTGRAQRRDVGRGDRNKLWERRQSTKRNGSQSARKQSAEDLRTASREQRTKTRKRRTEDREQRTENREQRTENREQPRLSPHIPTECPYKTKKPLPESRARDKGFRGFTCGFCTCWTLQQLDCAIAGLYNRLAVSDYSHSIVPMGLGVRS